MLGIKLDLAPTDARLIGDAGLDFVQSKEWNNPRQELLNALTDPAPGYTSLPDQQVDGLLEFAAAVSGDLDDVLVLGIGGSGLGARMLNCAFIEPAPRRPNYPRLHVVDNVDPRRLYHLLTALDPQHTLVVVVTKSGSTAETMANYAVVRAWLEALLGDDYAAHLAVVTDPHNGDLRSIAESEDLASFAVPPDVGGRFSVLSPVGLLPAALTGLDVEGLLRGAAVMRRRTLKPDWRSNPALALALCLHAHHSAGRRIVGVMPYADGLRDFALWFCQLWAESLGKRADYGPTPQAALGATDQHSQIQLYTQGPADKVVWMLEVAEHDVEVEVPDKPYGYAALDYLAGTGLGELLAAERRGTTLGLVKAGTPSFVLTLPKLEEPELGALIYLCEAATSLTGRLAELDAYNQPGVEEGKKATYALLGRPGYEERRREDAELETSFAEDLVSLA